MCSITPQMVMAEPEASLLTVDRVDPKGDVTEMSEGSSSESGKGHVDEPV